MNESPDPIPSYPQGQGPPLFPKLVGGTSRDRSELRRESWGRCGLAGAPASKSFLPAEPPQGFWGAAASLGSGKFPLRGGKGMGIIHRLACDPAERRHGQQENKSLAGAVALGS